MKVAKPVQVVNLIVAVTSPLSPDVSCDRMLAREMEKRDKEVRRLREQHEFELLKVSCMLDCQHVPLCRVASLFGHRLDQNLWQMLDKSVAWS